MNGKVFLALSSALLLAAMLSVQIGNGVDLVTQWQLVWAQREASSFAEFNFLYGQLPRLVMTLLVGAMLGLVGSVMQQLTQNNLTSPLTLGTSSGAWLALIILNIGFPSLVASYSTLAAMSGALLAFSLIVVIAGVRNMTGLPLIVAGMVVNLLLGAIATALILLNEQYAKNVFMWGGRSGAKWLGLGAVVAAAVIGLFIDFTVCTKGSDVIAFRSSRCCGSWSACHSCIFNLNGARDLVGFSLDYSGGRHQFYRATHAKHRPCYGGKNAQTRALFELTAWRVTAFINRYARNVLEPMDYASHRQRYHSRGDWRARIDLV
ncbi:Iron(III) ABC transporter, permease protein [Vibrio anguillarum]|nr:Iron(III) ABC transporter, permease protein [Vibrio anguillarum]